MTVATAIENLRELINERDALRAQRDELEASLAELVCLYRQGYLTGLDESVVRAIREADALLPTAESLAAKIAAKVTP